MGLCADQGAGVSGGVTGLIGAYCAGFCSLREVMVPGDHLETCPLSQEQKYWIYMFPVPHPHPS